jgi:hypothetical protein
MDDPVVRGSISKAMDAHVTDLASAIAAQAQAIADGTVIGPVYAAVQRLLANANTLAAWIPDDRK